MCYIITKVADKHYHLHQLSSLPKKINEDDDELYFEDTQYCITNFNFYRTNNPYVTIKDEKQIIEKCDIFAEYETFNLIDTFSKDVFNTIKKIVSNIKEDTSDNCFIHLVDKEFKNGYNLKDFKLEDLNMVKLLCFSPTGIKTSINIYFNYSKLKIEIEPYDLSIFENIESKRYNKFQKISQARFDVIYGYCLSSLSHILSILENRLRLQEMFKTTLSEEIDKLKSPSFRKDF